jgi:DNA repair exonuclease SbcCD nuclease subunit
VNEEWLKPRGFFLRIAHIADTHIRNYKYHREYRAVFDQIYERLRKEKPDCIVHCGDLAHTKTQLSPEYFDLATSFLKNLADIAPVYIILGNHDGNLKNTSRQDAITPIATALNHPDLHLIKNAGEVPLRRQVTFNVLSVFDEENWVEPTNPDKINIALYHGSVAGVVTDTGWVMTHGDHHIDIFKNFDYALLGDIHKTNQILDGEIGKVRYPGSTVQQNFAESNDKGFLLWDIQDKENFTCEHIAIQNPSRSSLLNLHQKAGCLAKQKFQWCSPSLGFQEQPFA